MVFPGRKNEKDTNWRSLKYNETSARFRKNVLGSGAWRAVWVTEKTFGHIFSLQCHWIRVEMHTQIIGKFDHQHIYTLTQKRNMC